MNKEYLKKYCKLVIQTGINLYPGQCLQIKCGEKNYDFALMLAETAYVHGAKYVDIRVLSNHLLKYRIENNIDASFLEFVPNYLINYFFERASNDWASIHIENLEEPDVLSKADPSKQALVTKHMNKAFDTPADNIENQWCVIAVPGPGWASMVFNKTSHENSVNELWDKVIPILRLNKKDPLKAWNDQGQRLIERSKILNDMKLDKLIFEGPSTNLEVGLNKNSKWNGGPAEAQNGRKFIPNIPTEEVYTTPDFKRTNGRVKITRPVDVLDNILKGVWFEFENGRVIKSGAESNSDLLEKFLDIDEGASQLGEVALVDKDSEVYKSGLLFNCVLFDENAACHIALGNGIKECFVNSKDLITNDDKKRNGCNHSLVHNDFMIGSDEINVTGITQEGIRIELISDGKFRI